MPHSQLKEVWKGTKFLPKLKSLSLSYSHYLTCTPDFSGLLNLEKLFLHDCLNLVEVHESIDHLSKLDVFILRGCRKLRNLPNGIGKLTSLETFDITGCSQLEELPEGIGNLTRLTSLRTVGTAIEELPASFKFLKNLTTFEYSGPIQSHSYSLGGCFFEILKKLATCFAPPMQSQSSSIPSQSYSLGIGKRNAALLSTSLYGLIILDLKECNLTDDDIPDDLWKLCSLKELDLSYNDFLTLPSSICQLSKLEKLSLWGCKSLQSLPMLPSSLCSLSARDCTLLERLNLSNLKHLRFLDLVACSKLNEIEGLGGLESGEIIEFVGCDNLDQKMLFQEICEDFQNRDICELYLSGSEIPEWFDYQNESPSLASCQVTLLNNMDIRGLIVCTVHPSSEVPDLPDSKWVAVHNQSKNSTWSRYKHFDCRDHIWVIKIPHCVWKSIADCGDIVNVSVEDRFPWAFGSVKKIGVHLFYLSHEKASKEIPKQPEAFNALEYISYTASTS
ncbi:hypothetical protein NE237_021949 [Protea cynaroides]|uniref:Uncharacterized protein n=1 Tax=Protea cynaroides TaxID=273540 RepID=A0A9Q0HA38_9MAGN|nr:hypothetical protein NE237_021949 [Protea cynaroides]